MKSEQGTRIVVHNEDEMRVGSERAEEMKEDFRVLTNHMETYGNESSTKTMFEIKWCLRGALNIEVHKPFD